MQCSSLARSQLFLSARKVKDSSNQLKRSIAKTQSIENFDYNTLRKVVTVENMVLVMAELQESKNLMSAKNTRRFNCATGAVATSLVLTNGCHWVDISWLTLADLQNGLESANDKFVVFQPSKSFKGSFSKKTTIFKLSLPSR